MSDQTGYCAQPAWDSCADTKQPTTDRQKQSREDAGAGEHKREPPSDACVVPAALCSARRLLRARLPWGEALTL